MSENLIGATTAVFPIRLSVAVTSPVDVEWATRDGSAIAGSDYKAASGTVTFLPGETEKQIEVQVYGQAITPADDKVFFIRLNPPSNAVLVDAILTCTINIIDDQGIPSVAVVVAEGRRGPKGDPGLSAYEQAVLMGYTGTLAEWMDQIADASKAADRAGDHAISAGEDALKAQNASKNAVFAGVVFPTTAEGVDPILGVQNGAYFNVRSPLSEHYINEYQNVNGVAVATGKSYPTSEYVQNISDHTALPFVTGESYALNRRVQLDNGDIVKSTIDGNVADPNTDMTGWVKTNSASQVFDESGKNQQEINNTVELNVLWFGAKGDGVTDDSEAFRRAALSPLTGNNLVLPSGAFKFKIDSTVDLKGKGLVSNSYHKSASETSSTSILVTAPTTNFTNGAVFTNQSGIVKGVTGVCTSSTNDAKIRLFSYSGNLTNCKFHDINLRGFANLAQAAGITVLAEFVNINSIACHDVLVDILGTGDSTTLTFRNVIHQYADGYALRVAGNLYGSTFDSVTLENVGGGLFAKCFRNCSFDQIWAEDNRGTVKDWVEFTTTTANDSNITGIVRCIAGTWTDPTEGGNWGGVKIGKRLTVANSNGAKLQVTYDTIQPLPNSTGTTARHLNLCAAAKNANVLSDINFKGHSGRINFKNLEADVFGNLDIKRDIGANASNTASEVGTDYWSLQEKHFTVKDVGSNKSGILFAPALLSYDVTVPARNENGAYTITKDTSVPVGKYVLAMRVDSHTDNRLRYPHVIVGGFVSTQPILYYIVPRQSGGTWVASRIATGFDIYLTDKAGTPIDVDRFTIMMTFGLTSFIA